MPASASAPDDVPGLAQPDPYDDWRETAPPSTRALSPAVLGHQVHVEVRPPSDNPALTAVLDEVRRFVSRFVAFPSEHEAVAIALWTAHTYLLDQFDTSPILAVTSAEKRSGKSRVLEVLALLVPNPEPMTTPSEAALYVVLNERPPRTVLLDEVDAIFGPRADRRKIEGLRAILNAGNRRGTTVPRVRMDGAKHVLERFAVFGPKAVAGIGDLPDTVADRSIPIRLKRRAPDEQVEPFRARRSAADAEPLRARLESLSVRVPTETTVPAELHDRAADSWEPLLAIAEAAGGGWSESARRAAIHLSGRNDGQLSIGARLLGDVRAVFGGASAALATADLLARLHAIEDAPWSEWGHGPLTPRGLSRLLQPFGIGPRHYRPVGGRDQRGYWPIDFADAWRRYLPDEEEF
jgi:hypothetical protein